MRTLTVRNPRRATGAGTLRAIATQPPPPKEDVPLSRIAWMVAVGICVIAALLLFLGDYSGYAGVLLAVGAAAAVNLI